MNKLLECIYAYICNNTYLGKSGNGDQIYNVTDNLSADENYNLSDLVQNTKKRAYLENIDVNEGVALYGGERNPDYSLSSYIYVPGVYKNYGTFCCSTLRASLKSLNIRGSKELSHVIGFNQIQSDFYIADLIGAEYFRRTKDVSLDESQTLKDTALGDVVFEVVPNKLPEISWDRFASSPLNAYEVYQAGRGALKALSEFVHALLISKRQGKTLYVVYNTNEYPHFLNYLKIVLKLFPASVSNTLSFITANGDKGMANCDICGVPTSDPNYVLSLKQFGNVIKITGLDVDYLGGEKGAFATFLQNADQYKFEAWLTAFNRYKYSISTLDDIDTVAALYVNILGKDFDGTGPVEYLYAVSACVELINDKFLPISSIDNELESQVRGVETQITQALGAFSKYSCDMIKERLINPLLSLYQKCRQANAKEASVVLNLLKNVLFGLNGQGFDLKEKHYEVFSLCHSSVKDGLASDYSLLILAIENDWDRLREFFDGYLNAPQYLEASTKIVLSLLEYYLKDFESAQGARIRVRDYLVYQFLKLNPRDFAKIADIIFNNAGLNLRGQYAYVLDEIFKKFTIDAKALLLERIKHFAERAKTLGVLKDAIEFYKVRYINQYSGDSVLTSLFEELLKHYFAPSQSPSLNDLCDLFAKAKELLSDSGSSGLAQFVIKNYVETALIPKCSEAVKAISFEAVTDALEIQYRNLVDGLKAFRLNDTALSAKLLEIETFLNDYSVYKNQTKREDAILRSRIDFVVGELLLLENKTIYKILSDRELVSSSIFKKNLKEYEITRSPHRHPDFLECAQKTAEEFLQEGEAKKRVAFCKKIREERKRKNEGGRKGLDALGHFIGSAVFALFMGVIAAALGWVVLTFVAEGYFRNIYIVFAAIVAIISIIIYWTNFKDRRLRNAFLMSLWQSLLLIVATVGVFALTQYVMAYLAV